MNKEFDIVVVGSGIAGLSFSLYLQTLAQQQNKTINIAVLAKGRINETNTAWAQGGIAAVAKSSDSFEDHINDTLKAGAYLNDVDVVKMVVENAPQAILDLRNWGVRFDKKLNDEFDLAKEGGHKHNRIWHFEDATGKEIQRALICSVQQQKNVLLFEHFAVTHLYKNAEGFFIVETIHQQNNQQQIFKTKQVVLAGGGVGAVFQHSTNQPIATGDAVVLANRLGCEIEKICFIQFHPTGMVGNHATTFLISEALRGAGAILRNKNGEAFMINYDERKDLAPRDIVSRSILSEMKKDNTEFVYLDATSIDEEIIKHHFPNIFHHCLQHGIDIRKQFIPVVPTQHYSCGGIKTNKNGETNIHNLFALGECACTGLHGANRLASNSLLEAIVFAKTAAQQAFQAIGENKNDVAILQKPTIKKVERKILQEKMSEAAGVIRSTKKMQETLSWMREELNKATIISNPNIQEIETQNLYELSVLILENALQQKENKGVHYNVDLG